MYVHGECVSHVSECGVSVSMSECVGVHAHMCILGRCGLDPERRMSYEYNMIRGHKIMRKLYSRYIIWQK